MTVETLSLPIIEGALTTEVVGRPAFGANELHDQIDSTNTRAAQLARDGAAEGTLVLARQQTAGRGRQGRSWSSPPDAGIALSVILRPQIPLQRLPLITLATGAACASAIEQTCGIKLGLKWVNDLTYGGKKVGGILAEMPGQALVIGLGINIRLDLESLPEDLKAKVEWLENITATPVSPNLIVIALARKLEDEYNALKNGQDLEIIERWKSYSITIGKEIIAQTALKEIRGRAVDLTASGALIVESADGTRTDLTAGEITIRMADGSYC